MDQKRNSLIQESCLDLNCHQNIFSLLSPWEMWGLCRTSPCVSQPGTMELTALHGKGDLANLPYMDLHSLVSRSALHTKMNCQGSPTCLQRGSELPESRLHVVFGKAWKNSSQSFCFYKLSWKVEYKEWMHMWYMYLLINISAVYSWLQWRQEADSWSSTRQQRGYC